MKDVTVSLKKLNTVIYSKSTGTQKHTKKGNIKIQNSKNAVKNGWNLYKPTLKYLDNRLNYYEAQLRKFMLHHIAPDANPDNTRDQDVLGLNAAVFTYFNNVPDIFHPLTTVIYFNYISFICYIDPLFFCDDKGFQHNVSCAEPNVNGIQDDIITYKSVLEHDLTSITKLFHMQDIAPYNKNKRQLAIHIRHFDISRYIKTHVVLCYTSLGRKIVSVPEYGGDNINANANGEDVLDIKTNERIVYACILRKMEKNDLLKVFAMETISKNTRMYSLHANKFDRTPNWYSFSPTDRLNDPFRLFYKPGDKNYKYCSVLLKSARFLNLSKCIFLKSAPNNVNTLLTMTKKQLHNFKARRIYNGELNYIKYYPGNDVWYLNMGKRLLGELFFKSSKFNYGKHYYFDWLYKHNIDKIIYSYGYYEKFDKFYNYEIGFYNPENWLKLESVTQITIE